MKFASIWQSQIDDWQYIYTENILANSIYEIELHRLTTVKPPKTRVYSWCRTIVNGTNIPDCRSCFVKSTGPFKYLRSGHWNKRFDRFTRLGRSSRFRSSILYIRTYLDIEFVPSLWRGYNLNIVRYKCIMADVCFNCLRSYRIPRKCFKLNILKKQRVLCMDEPN